MLQGTVAVLSVTAVVVGSHRAGVVLVAVVCEVV